MKDIDLVNSIVTNDSVWDFIREDGTPDNLKENIAKMYLENESVYVLNPADGIIFILVPFTSVTIVVHTCIIADARGKAAFSKTIDAMSWVFNNTNYQKIISWVPAFNKVAMIFALKSGMVKEGTITKSFKKDGILHDQFVVGITKEAWQCQQQAQQQ